MTRSTEMLAIGSVVALGLGCTASETDGTGSDRIEAGREAVALGVAAYDVNRVADRSTIALIAPDGSALGALELSVDPIAVDPTIEVGEYGPPHIYDRVVRYRSAKIDQELLRAAAGVVAYLDYPDARWVAALTDPALAPVFAADGLQFERGPGPERDLPIELEQPYLNEYQCCGHRQGSDQHFGALYQYQGCRSSCGGSGDFYTEPIWEGPSGATCEIRVHHLVRYCNDSCCANGDCMSTGGSSPCGPPYGPAGCYTSGAHWDTYYCYDWSAPGPIRGHVDGVFDSATSTALHGWACARGSNESIQVHLYVGGAAGSGGTFVTAVAANLASEPRLAQTCAASGAYRFQIPLERYKAQYGGRALYVHGISPSGLPNELLLNSGVHVLPALSQDVLGHVDGVFQTSAGRVLTGWACARTSNGSIAVNLYAGGAAGTGAYVTAAVADLASEPAVAWVCSASGTAYRFEIPLEPYTSQLAGSTLFVHGISPFGLPHHLLDNSGAFAMPAP